MEYVYSKQAKKVLKRMENKTANRIVQSLKEENLKRLHSTGSKKELYRIKLYHYRIILEKQEENKMFVKNILTKSDATFRRTQCYF